MANRDSTPPPSSATRAGFAGAAETEAMAGRAPRPNLSYARVAALLILAAAVIQTILAIVFLAQGAGGHEVKEWHGSVGMVTVIICAVASILAVLSSRHGGPKYPFYVGLAMTVLAVIQVGLGEAHVKMLHMSIGVLFLAGAAWLTWWVYRYAAKATR